MFASVHVAPTAGMTVEIRTVGGTRTEHRTYNHREPDVFSPLKLAPEGQKGREVLADWQSGNLAHVLQEAQTGYHCAEKHVHVCLEQKPFGSILACIDSRATPELVVNHLTAGKNFVVRTAGQLVGPEVAFSMGFTASKGVNLAGFMGHTNCGAVEAALEKALLTFSEEDLSPEAKGKSPVRAIARAVKSMTRPLIAAAKGVREVLWSGKPEIKEPCPLDQIVGRISAVVEAFKDGLVIEALLKSRGITVPLLDDGKLVTILGEYAGETSIRGCASRRLLGAGNASYRRFAQKMLDYSELWKAAAWANAHGAFDDMLAQSANFRKEYLSGKVQAVIGVYNIFTREIEFLGVQSPDFKAARLEKARGDAAAASGDVTSIEVAGAELAEKIVAFKTTREWLGAKRQAQHTAA